jgi:hypothetical protein
MNSEYQKAAAILSDLLELDGVTKQKISEQIQAFGLGHFLENVSAFDFTPEVRDKLQMLYLVLRYIETDKITDSLAGMEVNTNGV